MDIVRNMWGICKHFMTPTDFLKNTNKFPIKLLETPYTNQNRILIEMSQGDTDMLNLCNINGHLWKALLKANKYQNNGEAIHICETRKIILTLYIHQNIILIEISEETF